MTLEEFILYCLLFIASIFIVLTIIKICEDFI